MGEAPTIARDQDDDGPGLDGEDATESDGGTGAEPDVDVAEAVEDANAEQGDKTDVEEVTVELDDDDFSGDNGLFDGVEDSENQATDAGGQDDSDEQDDDSGMEGMAGLDGNAEALEDAINEGAARMGVVGLTDADFDDDGMTRDDLETEFAETFAAFRLGYFGSQTIDKYVLQPADGDVNPAWGMAGAALMATAMVVWMRPDGDEKMAGAREAIEGIMGGGDA